MKLNIVIHTTVNNRKPISLVMAIFGNTTSLFAFITTLLETIVRANTKPPIEAPRDINAPSAFAPALEFDSKSGAPLANAIRVTAAKVGDRLNLSDKSYIPTARYLSAIPATQRKRIGKKTQMNMNIRIAFLSVCL